MLEILVIRSMKPEDWLELNLGCIQRLCLRNKKTKQNTTNPVVLPPKLEHVKRTEVCDISL